MQEYSQPPNHRLEQALDHPTRRAILDLLVGGKVIGSSSIAEKLGIPAAHAAYHLDVLAACGAIEVTKGERPGQRLVCLPRSAKRKENPLGASGSMREDVTEAQLKSLIEMAAHLRPGHAPGAGA